jgi:hypothetical protein
LDQQPNLKSSCQWAACGPAARLAADPARGPSRSSAQGRQAWSPLSRGTSVSRAKPESQASRPLSAGNMGMMRAPGGGPLMGPVQCHVYSVHHAAAALRQPPTLRMHIEGCSANLNVCSATQTEFRKSRPVGTILLAAGWSCHRDRHTRPSGPLGP